MAPLEMMGRLDRATGFSTGVNFSAKLASAPASGFNRASAPTKAANVADDCEPTLTKADLTELVFEHVGLNKREAKDMVESFFTEISDALGRGEPVKLTGFGNFQLRDKVSRLGRNPKTGVDAAIPARRVVTFRASQKLKTAADESAVASTSEHIDGNARA